MKVPAFDKYALSRTEIDIPTLPFYESLDAEVGSKPRLLKDMEEYLSEAPQIYKDHPVVRSAGVDETVWPVCIYFDGVPFQKKDGLLAFYCCNLVSGIRHLSVV